MTTTTDTTQRLQKLGLTKAAKVLPEREALYRKLTEAYTYYRYVPLEAIEKFRARLRKESEQRNGRSTHYKTLAFTALADYEECPPSAVLDVLDEAQGRDIFDTFEIAKVEWVEEVADPILFGRITGCEDRFFIAQWDEDVRIEDLLQPDEGYVKEGFTQ